MSNFPIHINKEELREWHEFARLEGWDSTAAFVRQAVRDKIQGRKDTLELLKILGIPVPCIQEKGEDNGR